jgi:16S rRNA (guanine966-N2)-methyltransferase
MTRIVGGSAGGRRLSVPAGREVRPTSERVREALASAIEARLGGPGGLRGQTVLDLFAGTGAVGLELLSRGAAAVTLVEASAAVRKVLEANVADLGLRGATVVAARAETFLATTEQRWDLAFLDPPYALDVQPIIDAAAEHTRLLLIVERDIRSEAPTWPEGFEALHHRRYGDSALWYGLRSCAVAASDPGNP